MNIKSIIIIILVLIFTTATKAQELITNPQLYKNNFYGYAGTTLACWSTGVFYEREIYRLQQSTLNVRAGMGLYAFLWGDYGYYYVANIGHVLGTNKHHFEYNLGVAIYNVTYDNYTNKYPSAYVGYRFHKPNGKYMFRTGFGWPEQLSAGMGINF